MLEISVLTFCVQAAAVAGACPSAIHAPAAGSCRGVWPCSLPVRILVLPVLVLGLGAGRRPSDMSDCTQDDLRSLI